MSQHYLGFRFWFFFLYISFSTLGRAQDYFCLSSGLEYLLSLSKSTKSPALAQAALYTMAMATEGNGELIRF